MYHGSSRHTKIHVQSKRRVFKYILIGTLNSAF